MANKEKISRNQIENIKKGIESDYPLSKVSSNIYGPFDLMEFSENGHGFFIRFIDVFIRFIKICFSKKITSKFLITTFQEGWLSNFGKPTYFVSDNGPQYMSISFKRVYENLEIKNILITPFNLNFMASMRE